MKKSKHELQKTLDSLLPCGGYFKTTKQANFMINQSESQHIRFPIQKIFGNEYHMEYIIDTSGIVRIEKHLKKEVVVTWERRRLGVFTVQDRRKLKKYQKDLIQSTELGDWIMVSQLNSWINQLKDMKRYAGCE